MSRVPFRFVHVCIYHWSVCLRVVAGSIHYGAVDGSVPCLAVQPLHVCVCACVRAYVCVCDVSVCVHWCVCEGYTPVYIYVYAHNCSTYTCVCTCNALIMHMR